MALRKQWIQDVASESQQEDEDVQEDKAAADIDDEDENSSSLLTKSFTRDKCWKERDSKPKSKEMTEEEMMDLALRLSEQEASNTALQQQQEEADVREAIRESMVSQTQPCQTSVSQTVFADSLLRLPSRRKLSYLNGETLSIVCQEPLEDGCRTETDVNSAKGAEDENINRNKKRKRKEESPLLEMPDLSQTQKISRQTSPCSSECLSAALDSSQSSDLTQIDNSQLQKSPIFPLTGCRAAVHIHRLSQDLVDSCRESGFVLSSQDSCTLTGKSAQPKSPTFPQSDLKPCPKSPIFSTGDLGVDGQTQLSSEFVKSPVFGRNTQHERSPSACKHHVSVCSPACENPEFVFSSQENVTPSMRCESCPESPVFPKSPGPHKILPPSHLSLVPKSPCQGETDRSHGLALSPVFSLKAAQQSSNSDTEKKPASPSAARLQGSKGEASPPSGREVAGCQADNCNTITQSEELNEKSKDLNHAETVPMSDMTLVWSDGDDDDVTPVGSPSPVFPEESPAPREESQADTLNHSPAASVEPNCRRQQLSSPEHEMQPVDRDKLVGGVTQPLREPLGEQTVHYYWGVPFCPRGLDPDQYTKVIEAQMEVYEKSLKEAQRLCLPKVEWGEAILPQPEKCASPEVLPESPQRDVPRRRRGKRGETTDTPSAEAEEKTEEKEEQDNDKKDEDQQMKEEKEKNGGNEEQMDTEDCEVCPETQLSDNNSTQDLVVTDAAAELSPKSPELPEIETTLRNRCPVRAETKQEAEKEVHVDASTAEKENISGCRTGAGGQTAGADKHIKDRTDPDLEVVKDRGIQRLPSPEPEAAFSPRTAQSSIKCPICQVPFPVNEIEMHAAYCDGDVAVVDERRPDGDRFQESLKHRGKRTRKTKGTAEATNDFLNVSRNQEKCFICQKAVPLSEYDRHTDLCLQRRSGTAAKGNLLLALEKTESMDFDARPSGSKSHQQDIIDLRDDDDDEEGTPAFPMSDSPIKSFTSISEATDCLIDFKKQYRSKRPTKR
ncbi:BRCA1-A complex subunit RAP80 isoform X2 [Cololabis saira]|uniref:BRCA1-A complex subunit RAP80 isoform X2 n=1 Tax=Cololabis saira TaxID=129043 RepID=UPI002AD3B343|nr:BRCA1-A complex subunit RAP80 isoform X2 [Cololabis saira]